MKQEDTFAVSLSAESELNGPESEWKNPQHLGKAMS